jgi:superfamily II RNA helicase
MLQETEKNKKIDFKEKSLMAKEASIKKIVAKSTKEAGGQGGKGPNNNKAKHSGFQKALLNIQKMKLLPTIVFAFSRAGCLELA